ncbi:MAG: hypothetical protein M3518_06685 [Actinomycetota bacterium]|nr:hypothetical protein [Actinomycetota bacterium]
MTTVFSVFKVVAAITAAWFLALLVATGLVFGILGDVVAFWVHTTLMGALALLSGPLLFSEIRNSAGRRERGEWSTSELLYALVFTFTLFIFLNSVAYLYFSV